MTETTSTPLTRTQIQQRWQTAFARAAELGGQRQARYSGDGYFTVASSSGKGDYDVRLAISNGQPAVTCTCPAGDHDLPCWHKAAVLLNAGFVADDAESASDEPRPIVPAYTLYAENQICMGGVVKPDAWNIVDSDGNWYGYVFTFVTSAGVTEYWLEGPRLKRRPYATLSRAIAAVERKLVASEQVAA